MKWLFSYLYIELWRRGKKKRLDLYDMDAINDPIKCAFLIPPEEYALESPQSEGHLLNAADEVFVYGVNSSSECLIARIARASNSEADSWIYLKLKEGKVYQLKESANYQHSCSDTEREFTCGGFKMHYILPMRKWRVFYNGLLRETCESDPSVDRMVHVKFAFTWTASSDCFDLTCDINSTALAMAFAKTKWKSVKPPLKELNNAFNCYAHSGSLHGSVSIDGDTTERHLYLFGERVRFLGSTSLEDAEFTHILGQVLKNGMIIHIAEATIPNVVTKLQFGYAVLPNGNVKSAFDPNMMIDLDTEKQKGNFESEFNADGKVFQFKGVLKGKQSHFESKKGWDGFFSMDCLDIELDSLEGKGVLLRGKISKQSQRRKTISIKKDIPQRNIPYILHFSEELCEMSEITGGKGSSLGKLTQMSKEFQNFIVPNGVVVTTSAYQRFINNDILKEIEYLEDVLYENVVGDVKDACQRVMDEVIKANMPDVVLQAIIKCLQNIFGDELHEKRFAIRSSATGEDTEQMSAAGQMETFLGIKGLSEIISAVKKCWASQFGFIAVKYKRQNGQVLNSPMAVVIQEMVPCDVAGVLFTCDPLTGNPTLMSITANYGLGESVVSGSEEPDSIVICRVSENDLEIKEKIIGAKSRRIIVKDEGTGLEDVSDNEKTVCCLPDTMILRLGKVAVQIERNYRSNRDIEWGFWNNNLYIFQSRPVTSGTEETDFEIDHEFDAPMRIEHESFTMCNVGEVMPGAMSTLGADILFKYFNVSFMRKAEIEWQSTSRPKYYQKGIMQMYSHVMFYLIELLERVNEGRSVIEATMVAMFGRVLEDEEIYEIAWERYGRNPKKSALKKYYFLCKNLFLTGSKLKETLKHYQNYHVPVENCKTAQEAFDTLMHACDEITESMTCHMYASQASSIWNMIIISILKEARGGMCSDVYRDFAKLLTSISEVESADVPSAIQSLAFHIGKEINAEDLKKMNCKEIEQWLTTSSTEAGVKFREFLQKHGHRCLKEFDIRSITWGSDPKPLIQLLKNLVGNVSQGSQQKQVQSFDEMLSNIELPLGFMARQALKFLLPRSRSGVQYREASKSLLIKVLNEWRKGYRHLAKLMVSEGRIPDEDILYFMVLTEIQELLKTRSPKIISKASHRRRRHPELDRYIFPEIMVGFPQPVNLVSTLLVSNEDNFKMKGIPVSQGVAKGFVRVALNLEEASHLKPGEILLTYSTDIGWSPYFPMLAGVVTELGGLISHGAVVSREYGLPCIAGLHGATRQFVTGDYVLLDGNRGILQKIAPPE